MQCRKCGAKRTTKRRAGVFSCRRCGVLPGPFQMDRMGFPAPVTEQATTEAGLAPYVVSERTPRLKALSNQETAVFHNTEILPAANDTPFMDVARAVKNARAVLHSDGGFTDDQMHDACDLLIELGDEKDATFAKAMILSLDQKRTRAERVAGEIKARLVLDGLSVLALFAAAAFVAIMMIRAAAGG